MQIEERYRAALIALRDSQWEEATRNLLAIATTDPSYRDIDRVLKVLERTRGASYWCAAFDVAYEQANLPAAKDAVDQLTTINPDSPRLATMRVILSQSGNNSPEQPDTSDLFRDLVASDDNVADIDPFETWSSLPEPADDGAAPDFDDLLPLSSPPATQETGTTREGSDPIRKLDLDPLTELLLNDDWIADSNRPMQSDIPETRVQQDLQSVDIGEHDKPQALPVPQPEPDTPAGPSLDKTIPHQSVDNPVAVPLPTEPISEFTRLEPTASPDTKESPLTTDRRSLPDLRSSSEEMSNTEAPPHRYSPLQALGLLLFPLLLFVVVSYVLFGQGGPTLTDMIANVQNDTAINSASDLIGAVDSLVSGEMPSSETLAELAELSSITEVIAEESPELQTILNDWIAAMGELVETRETKQNACTDETTTGCTTAEAALEDAQDAALQGRATACALIDCPEQPTDSP